VCSSVLLWVVLLILLFFIVGGIAYVYMCGFLVDKARLCFGFMCSFVHICV